MNISVILGKLASGQTLDAGEQESLRLEVENIDRAAKLVNSWVIPGSSIPFIRDLQTSNVRIDSGEIQLGEGQPGEGFSGVRIGFPAFTYDNTLWNIAGIENDVLQVGFRASDGVFVAGGGNVVISSGGINIFDDGGNQYLAFYNAAGDVLRWYFAVDENGLGLISFQQGQVLSFHLEMTNADTPYFSWEEDPAQTNRPLFTILSGIQGSRLVMGNGGEIDLRTAGTSGGSTFIRILETPVTPPNGADDSIHIYAKANKIVFQFNDGGTIRYKYLDLTGTGVTWVHTTSAP